MSIEYLPYRRKRLLQEMKTCKAWIKKVASGMREVATKKDEWMRIEAAALEDVADGLQTSIELFEKSGGKNED